MPMGIVNERDWNLEVNNSCIDSIPHNQNDESGLINNELNNESNIEHRTSIVAEVLDMPTVGRHEAVSNIPDSLRKVLADDHLINGLRGAKSLVHGLGIDLSQPTLSTYGRGETSPHSKSKKTDELTDYLNGRKEKITKRALNKINLALSHLDEQKFLGLKAREISGVAKDMAIVAKQMEPTIKNSEGNQMNGVQFIMYAPQIKSEDSYQIVVAKDNY